MNQIQFPSPSQILHGHTSEETAYLIEDYPYGFTLRCQMKVWVETVAKKGDRYCTMTSNPKSGGWNKPKKSTFSYGVVLLVKDEKDHVKPFGIIPYEIENFPAQMEFLKRPDVFENLLSLQADHIRAWYIFDLRHSAPYRIVKYSDDIKEAYKQWVVETVKHVIKCEFQDLLNHPAPPEANNPDGEVRMTVKEYGF